MPLAPMLFIGCGGSGGKVILSLRRRLAEELHRRGWEGGVPSCFQTKWVDVPAHQESWPTMGPPLDAGDYLGLAVSDRYSEIDRLMLKTAGSRVDRFVGWRPSPNIQLPVLQGAGQMRGVGRCVALSVAGQLAELIGRSVGSLKSSQPELQRLARVLKAEGASRDPQVFVVSSLAGGTGAGVFLDVCDLIRAQDPALDSRIVGVLLTAEIFPEVGGAGIAANSLAAASELMSAMLAVKRPPEELYGGGSAMKVSQGSGPSAVYLVGLKTLDEGRSLGSPAEAYRVLSESLLAMALDEKLQQDIVNHDLTNRLIYQAERGSKFKLLSVPPGEGVPLKYGFVSGFGSAKISVGSSLFGMWARDRLVRSGLEYLLHGWRARGLELVPAERREAIRDDEIVSLLVGQLRERFFEDCGLWEEDEPDGTEHNQVLDSILSEEDLKKLARSFHDDLLGKFRSLGEVSAGEWIHAIVPGVRNHQVSFRVPVGTALDEGAHRFVADIVGRLESAVSKRIADFGVPVAAGLVDGLSQQCRSAIAQLNNEAEHFQSESRRDAGSSVSAAFASLGSGKVHAGSSVVDEALRKGIGPSQYWAMAQHRERAAEMLGDVVKNVLGPLSEKMAQLGEALDAFARTPEMHDWPAGDGVSSLYAPAPSEFCLVEPEEWGNVYSSLLGESAGSAESARDEILAGGFSYGGEAAKRRAPEALDIDERGGWAGENGRPVAVSMALQPKDLKERAEQWLFDPSHLMGRFLASGLREYLAAEDVRGNPVTDHQARLNRFDAALRSAQDMASPMFRVNQSMMARLHEKTDLETNTTIQTLPFDGSDPAYGIAEKILAAGDAEASPTFKSQASVGVESVLIVKRLAKPVHPAVVSSLYQPITREWDTVSHAQMPAEAVYGFWNNKRARLLNEFVPLPPPTVRTLVRGWFAGRLLGVITDCTPRCGPQIHYADDYDRWHTAEFPWPLLRHGREADFGGELADPDYKLEWLPALLEHLPVAMMMLSQDEHALDAYEQTYRLGDHAKRAVESFVVTGAFSPDCEPMIYGDAPDERKEDFKLALSEILEDYKELDSRTEELLNSDYRSFRKVPFGQELLPLIADELHKLKDTIESIKMERRRG